MPDPIGPSLPPQEPIHPSTPSAPPSSDQADAFLLQSPFAKMFRATGAMPTVKEIRAIINGILKQEIAEIKRQDAAWKSAMKKLKEAIEGET